MAGYQLSIITPTGEAYKGDAEAVKAPGALGSFGVLNNHAPMIVSLKSGPLTVSQSNQQRYFAIDSGILEVNDNSDVLVLTDSARPCDSYEEAKNILDTHD